MSLPRLILVTGKGGTGKSTVSAALALALSRRFPTTLADLDRTRTALVLAGAPGSGAARPASAKKNLELVALSPRAELENFLERVVPLKMLSRRMLSSRTFGYVTAALPGLEAFLMAERLRSMADGSRSKHRYAVVDGPACGGAIELLSVAENVGRLAPLGTLNRFAAGIKAFLRDPAQFAVLVTVMPDELALHEAIETASILRDRLGLTCIGAVLNGTVEALFEPAELAAASQLGGYGKLALRRNAMAERSARARRELTRSGLAVLELPMLFRPHLGETELRELSRRIGSAFLTR